MRLQCIIRKSSLRRRLRLDSLPFCYQCTVSSDSVSAEMAAQIQESLSRRMKDLVRSSHAQFPCRAEAHATWHQGSHQIPQLKACFETLAVHSDLVDAIRDEFAAVERDLEVPPLLLSLPHVLLVLTCGSRSWNCMQKTATRSKNALTLYAKLIAYG